MFGMRTFVAGSLTPAFEAVLDLVLGELGVVVLERATLPTWSARYDWARARADNPAALHRGLPSYEIPTIALTDARGLSPGHGERYVTLDVRTPRSPLWNLGLVRRLSARLGVWGGAVINDRLHDHYGTGFFYAGHAITAAACELSALVYGAGSDTVPWFAGSGVEIANAAHFDQRARRLADIRCAGRFHEVNRPVRAMAIAPREGGSLYDLEDRIALRSPEARAWVELTPPPAPVTQAIVFDRRPDFVEALRTVTADLADWELDVQTFEAIWSTYPIDLDDHGQPATVAILRSAGDDITGLLRALEPIPVAAVVLRFGLPDGAVEVWRRAAGQPFTRALAGSFDAVMDAYLPVTRVTDCAPIRWDIRMG